MNKPPTVEDNMEHNSVRLRGHIATRTPVRGAGKFRVKRSLFIEETVTEDDLEEIKGAKFFYRFDAEFCWNGDSNDYRKLAVVERFLALTRDDTKGDVLVYASISNDVD